MGRSVGGASLRVYGYMGLSTARLGSRLWSPLRRGSTARCSLSLCARCSLSLFVRAALFLSVRALLSLSLSLSLFAHAALSLFSRKSNAPEVFPFAYIFSVLLVVAPFFKAFLFT